MPNPRRFALALMTLAVAGTACRRGAETAIPSQPTPPPPDPATAVVPSAEWNAGLRIEQAEYTTPAGRRELLVWAMWYPTREEETSFSYELEDRYTSHVAYQAEPAESVAPFPLVVYAHGAFSSGYSLAFLSEHLARDGYVVVAPDYLDTVPPDFARPMAFSRILSGPADPIPRVFAAARQWVDLMNTDPDLMLAYLAEHRLGQTRFVIDQALAWNDDPGSPFYRRIDPGRIGIVGWSLGGSTALGLVGAHPDPGSRDERVDAALLLSAPAYPFQATLAQIAVPVMLMEGDDDENQAGPEFPRRMIYDQAPGPKFHLVLRDTTHYDFGNRPAGEQPLDRAVAEVPGLDAIAEYGLAFFDVYLQVDPTAAAALTGDHPGVALYEAVP